jgi:hypothetical protein
MSGRKRCCIWATWIAALVLPASGARRAAVLLLMTGISVLLGGWNSAASAASSINSHPAPMVIPDHDQARFTASGIGLWNGVRARLAQARLATVIERQAWSRFERNRQTSQRRRPLPSNVG